jgi:hypothetical protein
LRRTDSRDRTVSRTFARRSTRLVAENGGQDRIAWRKPGSALNSGSSASFRCSITTETTPSDLKMPVWLSTRIESMRPLDGPFYSGKAAAGRKSIMSSAVPA